MAQVPIDPQFGGAAGFTQDLGRGLNAPGANAPVQPSRVQQVSQALLSAAGAGANLLNATASIQAAQERKAGKAEQERLRREAISAARRDKNVQARLKEVRKAQFEILSDARAADPRWVLNRATTWRNNAFFDEDRVAWEDLILSQQGKLRTDAKAQARNAANAENQEFRQTENMSALSAQKAFNQLAMDVKQDPELRSSLIGDGKNIDERVIQHLTGQVMESAPYFFDEEGMKGDPHAADRKAAGDQLLAELSNRSYTITADLVKEQQKTQDENNQLLGQQNTEVIQGRFRTGLIDASQLSAELDTVIDTHFEGLSPAEQLDAKREMIVSEVERLARLTDLNDTTEALQKIGDLLSLGDLPQTETLRIQQEVVQKHFPQAMRGEFSSQLNKALGEHSRLQFDPQGNPRPPASRDRAARTLLAPVVPGGVDGYEDLANRFLLEHGISPVDPTAGSTHPVEARTKLAVAEAVRKQAQEARQLAVNSQVKIDDGVKAQMNLMGGAPFDPAKAWDNSLPVKLMQEAPSQEVYAEIQTKWKETFGDKELPWTGEEAYVPTAENEELTRFIVQNETAKWRGNPNSEIPPKMAQRLSTQLSSGDAYQMGMALDLYDTFGSRMQQKLMSGSELSAVDKHRLSWGNGMRHNGQATDSSWPAIQQRLGDLSPTRAKEEFQDALRLAGTLTGDRPSPQAVGHAEAISAALLRSGGLGQELAGEFRLSPFKGGTQPVEGQDAVGLLRDLMDDSKEDMARLMFQMEVHLLNPSVTGPEEAANLAIKDLWSSGQTILRVGEDDHRIVFDPHQHLNLEGTGVATVQDGFKQQLGTPFATAEDARDFATLIGADENVRGGALPGQTPYEIITRHVKRTSGRTLVPLEQMEVRVASAEGDIYNTTISDLAGGIPMMLKDPTLTDPIDFRSGDNPALLFSARRLRVQREETGLIPDVEESTIDRRRRFTPAADLPLFLEQ